MVDLSGRTFVMTGRVKNFGNREELAQLIREAGGSIANRITADTTALITNTPDSGTKKNRDADAFGVPKVTEDDFCKEVGIF